MYKIEISDASMSKSRIYSKCKCWELTDIDQIEFEDNQGRKVIIILSVNDRVTITEIK